MTGWLEVGAASRVRSGGRGGRKLCPFNSQRSSGHPCHLLGGRVRTKGKKPEVFLNSQFFNSLNTATSWQITWVWKKSSWVLSLSSSHYTQIQTLQMSLFCLLSSEQAWRVRKRRVDKAEIRIPGFPPWFWLDSTFHSLSPKGRAYIQYTVPVIISGHSPWSGGHGVL